MSECVALALCCSVCSSDTHANAWVCAEVDERVQSVHAVPGNGCLLLHATRVRLARAPYNFFAHAIVHATGFTARPRNSNCLLDTAGHSSNG